jgi:hypothetical protein
MSDSDAFTRFADRVSEPRPALEQRLEGEPWDDLGAFGWLRGTRERALMLELRRKNGHVLAVGYAWLEKAEFEPSDGIALHFVGQKVRLRGRNLNVELRPHVRLFDGIARHRVPWIREAGQGERLRATEGACVVEAIEW